MKSLSGGSMSLKGSNTSAEPLEWDEAIILYKSLLLHTCYIQSGSPNKIQHFLLSQKGMVYTIQRLNVIMKEWKYTYNLNVNNISTHTLRKTMATKLLSLYTDKILGIKAVQGALNHDSVDNTLRYLGISQDTYELWANSSKNICL